MAGPSIKEEVRKLVQLQDVDAKIFAFTKEKAQGPRMIEALQNEFEAKKLQLKILEDTKQKKLLDQKDKEGDLASKEEAIKKSQSQLGQLKTNKEYQTKLSEIEGYKADKSIIEEVVLKLMDEIDNFKKDIETEKRNMEAEEKKFKEKKNALNLRIKEIEGLLADLMGKRKMLADSIDKTILKQYEYILNGKDGLALVKIQENSCFGCYMKVPPQVINEIKMYDKLITCGMCARILYLEDDVQP